MRVQLPSFGLLGQRVCHLDLPRMCDLVALAEHDKEEVSYKSEVIKRISDVDFNKVTWCDIEFLYALTVASLSNGVLDLEVKCHKCGSVNTLTLCFGDLHITDLRGKSSSTSLSVNGKEYNFKLPSAQQILDCYDIAQYEGNTNVTFEHCKVSCIMFGCPEEWESTLNLTIGEYTSALLFDKQLYHGFIYEGNLNCTSCGSATSFRFKMPEYLSNIDMNTVLEVMCRINNSSITLQDALSLTLANFNRMIEICTKMMEE